VSEYHIGEGKIPERVAGPDIIGFIKSGETAAIIDGELEFFILRSYLCIHADVIRSDLSDAFCGGRVPAGKLHFIVDDRFYGNILSIGKIICRVKSFFSAGEMFSDVGAETCEYSYFVIDIPFIQQVDGNAYGI